jgi:oxygen-independent coproporphyrinogen-3 oxidase
VSGVLGIYIHIPFCKSKCDYCDFYSLAGHEEQMSRYQKALLAHIKALAPLVRGRPVDTIYFGGGTPSYYGEKRLRELLSALQHHFSVSRQAEITVECNPDSVEPRAIARLRRAGVNRISLGVQSADPGQLRCLHRIHTPRQAAQAVQDIRQAKIDNLSLDLIYGLPGQTMENWLETLSAAIALDPEHLSCYGLKVEEGTPLARRVAQGEEIPDGDCQADLYLKTVEVLQKAGYRQYEISNFAKTGKESRHNLKYWMGREYLGFGPGAHSYFAGRRYAYPRDLDGYIQGALSKHLVREEDQVITPPERAKEYLLLRLRTTRGIEEWEYRREFGLNFEPIGRRLEFFEGHHWAEQFGHRWRFTPQGFLLSNALILDLLEAQDKTLSDRRSWQDTLFPGSSGPESP